MDDPVGVDVARIERRWEESSRARQAAEQRQEDLRQIARWWDPWIVAWCQIGEAASYPAARSAIIDLIGARCAQLDVARERRFADAATWVSVYPICRSCGHRMASRDHRCLP